MTLQIEGQTITESGSSEFVRADEQGSSVLQGVSAEAEHSEESPPSSSSSKSRRNPPARNTSRFWFERFLAVIQRQNPSVIDSSFLSQIAPSNEGKLLAQLKFLKVIDDQGKATQLLPLLNLVGDAQKKGFHQMVEESYSDLLNEVKVDKAVPDDIVNYFIRRYSYTRDKAINASKFFLYLADKGSIQFSQELQSFYNEKNVLVSTQSNGGSSTALATPILSGRFAEKSPRIVAREQRVGPKNGASLPQKRGHNRLLSESPVQPAIQASIEIRLDKDTPKEYWDRVLALLGEGRNAEASAPDSSDGKIEGSEIDATTTTETDQ